MQNILAILPAYNEEASIGDLLNNFELVVNQYQLPLRVLVVNDGSVDRTVEVVKKFSGRLQVDLLDNTQNGGLGKVMRDGFKYACLHLNEGDVVITMDADNSHNPNLIPGMIQRINEGSAVVIASRYRPGSKSHGLSFFRRCTGFLAGSLFMVFAPIKGVRDYTCGFRAYRSELIKRGVDHFGDRLIEENGFSCMVEILLKLNRFHPVCLEVPMVLRYDLKKGGSKMNVRKTIQTTLTVLWHYLFTSRFK